MDATSPGHRQMLDQKTRTEARCDTGVSKTIVFGTPNPMVYHHGSYEKIVIWGYCILYFWTYPYPSIYKILFSTAVQGLRPLGSLIPDSSN